MTTEILISILSELQGMRKALEPKETTSGPISLTIDEQSLFDSIDKFTADQKPKPADVVSICPYCGSNNALTDGLTACWNCESTYTYISVKHMVKPPTDKQEDEIMKEVRQNMTDQKPKLPESWQHIDISGDLHTLIASLNDNVYKAFTAFVKLYYLRQAYWQAEGWEPDYTVNKAKDTIEFQGNRIVLSHTISTHSFLTFKAGTGQAEHFLQHHRSLIEQARELL